MRGLINLYKPSGISSRQAIEPVVLLAEKHHTGHHGAHKVGHAGTLDPLASGVLLVCVGQATRLIELVQQLPKTYRAEFRLGCTSPSDDSETEITPFPDAHEITRQEIESLLPRFRGNIEQTPPDYSAVKVQGKRAYKFGARDVSSRLNRTQCALMNCTSRALPIHSWNWK